MSPTAIFWSAVAALIGLLVVFGTVQTWRLKSLQEEYATFKAQVKANGERAKAVAEAKDQQHANEKKEMETRHAKEIQDRKERFASLYARYHGVLNDPSRSPVPQGTTSAGKPVPEGAICFDRERLAAGVSASLRRFFERVTPIIQRGDDSLGDQRLWGEFGRLTGSCQPSQSLH